MSSSSMSALTDRRITLEQLRVFVAVFEAGGFQNAAHAVGRSQSAVTQSLQKLEEYLNCQLVERRKGHLLGLTGQGARLLPEAKEILGRLDNAISLIQRPDLSGKIALGIPDSFDTSSIQSAVARCAAMNKGLKVQVSTALSADLAAQMELGLLDVVILQQHRNYDAPYSPPYGHILREERLYWVCSKGSDFRQQDELPLVTFPGGCTAYRNAALEALRNAGRPYHFSFVSGSFESVRGAIAAGFGVGVLPESEIGHQHSILGAADGLPELPNVCLLLQTRSESPVVHHFYNFLRSLPEFNRGQNPEAADPESEAKQPA